MRPARHQHPFFFLTRVPVIQELQCRVCGASFLTQPTHTQQNTRPYHWPARSCHPRPHHQRGGLGLKGAVGVVTRMQGDGDAFRVWSSGVHVNKDWEGEGDGAGEELERVGEVSAATLLDDCPEALVVVPHQVDLAS